LRYLECSRRGRDAGESVGCAESGFSPAPTIGGRNIALFYGDRAGSASNGSSCFVSTNEGVTWLDRPGVALMKHTSPTSATEHGYPNAVQRADGKLVWMDYFQVGSNLCNINCTIVDEDYLVNGWSKRLDCESFTADWTSVGAQATISATRAHNGTNSIKIDNSAGIFPHCVAKFLPGSTEGNSAKGIAFSHWCYITQIVSPQAINNPVLQDSTPANRVQVADFNAGAAKWYNGAAYQDTLQVTPFNEWVKRTVKASVTPTSAAARMFNNNVDLGAAVTQAANGSSVDRFRFQAGSVATTNAVTMWIDDVYTHQYAGTPPTVTLGAEQVNTVTVTAAILLCGAV
jgi:hypothetical protein